MHSYVPCPPPPPPPPQFLACVMSEEYQAARILCEKSIFYHSVLFFASIVSSLSPPVLECEPSNATAKEFLPVILERLRLGMCEQYP